MSKQTDTLTECAPPDSLHSVVGASGQRFSFFMRDGSLHEIEAADAEAALGKLGDKLDKPKWLYRYWLLEAIEACLAPDPNYLEP